VDDAVPLLVDGQEVLAMTIRAVVGTSWALAMGLAGGWLMLSPWALGEQPSGKDWTSVTRAEFFTGLGLAVLALAGLVLVASQAVRSLREAGVLAGRRTVARDSAQGVPDRSGEINSPEFESALVGLAQALTRELQSQPETRAEPAASNDQSHSTRRQEV
jgi:hypothetical protein